MQNVLRIIKKMGIFIIIGVIMGIVAGFFNIDPLNPIFILILIVIVSVIMFLSFGKNWILPIQMLNQGKYEQAIAIMSKVEDKNKGMLGYQRQALYNIAICYNLQGKFKESLNTLDQIKDSKLDRNIQAGYWSLYASNLIAIDENIDLAEEYIDNAAQVLDLPTISIAKAHIQLLKGNIVEADHHIQDALSKKKPKKVQFGFWSTFILDPSLNYLMENYSLGMYYYTKKDTEQAKLYLEKACLYEHANYYTKKANEILHEIMTQKL
jgi:tetratricopeptide (TPR) repeat protein